MSLFMMSTEGTSQERQSFKQQQELSIDSVDIDLQMVVLTALDCIPEGVTINEEEVEISYGNLTNNYRYILANKTPNSEFINRSTDLMVDRVNLKTECQNEDNLLKVVEHRIRGIPNKNQVTI